MLANNEIKVFIKWVVKWNLYTYIRFFINKIWNYLSRSRNRYINNYSYNYPSSLQKNLYKKCQFSVEKVIRFSSKKINITSIKLAGINLSISNNMVDWSKSLTDSEDEESLHRWNWSIYNLSSISEKDKLGLISWTQKQHENWIEKFQKEISDNATPNQLRWESYTVSERVSNSVIFYHLALGGWPSVDISKALKEQVYFLINHLEYFGKNTGNHVINNARAIYLAGVTFNCLEWRELAFLIIEREVPSMVTEDGFMREGSTHYQFLFTRWMLEVFYFAYIVVDKKMTDFLLSYINLLIKRCHFFLIYNKAEEKWRIPLFGDISPDFSPEWLFMLPWSNLGAPLVAPLSQYRVDSANCWNSLWNDVSITDFHIDDKTNQKISADYPQSGWFRGHVQNSTVFLRVDKKLVPEYVGHHHNDIYHFCLFCQGYPVLIDSGRLNYNPNSKWSGFGISERAHNSILIDGLGSIPRNNNLYPKSYAQANNRVNFVKKNESIAYSIYSSCFKRIHSNISVIRKIILKKNQCIVEDIFDGKGKHQVESLFHWGDDVKVVSLDENSWRISFGKYTGVFEIIGINKFKSAHYKGNESFLGWTVTEYGNKIPSSTLVFKGMVDFPASVKYKLGWEEN